MHEGKIVHFLTQTFFLSLSHVLFVFCFLLLFVSELGLLMKACIDQGQLVPDDVMSRLILNDLRAIDGGSWLLDGKFSQLCISTWFIW